MDNFTHSMIGLAAGEAVATTREKKRVPIWIASALANNLPDIDVFFTPLIGGGKLTSMLHHRGFTHTLLLGPLQSILLLILLRVIWRKREDIPWKEVIAVALLGPWLHIFADSWNSYGVHPFWPMDNRWYYGDMVFILEPWIWLFLIPPIYGSVVRKSGKIFLGLFYFGALIAAWKSSYVPMPMALALSLGALALIPVKNLAPKSRIFLSLFLLFAFLSGMFLVRQNIKSKFPGDVLAITPLPANPLCWYVIDAHADAEKYTAHRMLLAPFPRLFPVSRCANIQTEETTAPVSISSSQDNSYAKDLGTFTAPRTDLELIRKNCYGQAMLRFLRTPFWIMKEKSWLLGDLRYDREKGIGFTEIIFDPSTIECPRLVPPWQGSFLQD